MITNESVMVILKYAVKKSSLLLINSSFPVVKFVYGWFNRKHFSESSRNYMICLQHFIKNSDVANS
jgi:hypothetical protein